MILFDWEARQLHDLSTSYRPIHPMYLECLIRKTERGHYFEKVVARSLVMYDTNLLIPKVSYL